MRNLLALVGLLVVGFAGLGWYMGWYKLSFSRSADGNLEIRTDVDTKKVGRDTSEILKNAAAVVGEHVGKAAQDAKTTAPATSPGGTPGPVAPAQGPAFNPLAPTAPNKPVTPGTPITPGPSGPRDAIPLFPPK